MMAEDMPYHSGPIVSERACLANKGEVSGVRDAVVVVALSHVGVVHSFQYCGLFSMV